MRRLFSPATIDAFVPASIHAAGADRVRQARLCAAFGFGGVLVGLSATVLHVVRGSLWVAAAVGFGAVLCLLAPFLLRARGSLFLAGNLLTLAWFMATVGSALARGGTGAPSLAPSLIAPLLATLLVGKRSGLAWAGVMVLWIGALFTAREFGVVFSDQVPIASQPEVNAVMGVVFMAMTLGVGLIYEGLKNAALADLAAQAEEARRAHSERVRAEAEARLMFADRMASIGRLAAGVAHEVNNPLAYVIINLELLREAIDARPPKVTPDLLDAVHEALQGAMRVRAIVRDLKTFSRAEDEDLTPVDVHEVLDSILRMITNEARHRAKLVKNYGEIPNVLASESRLAQVFLNIVLNAVQAIPVGRADEDEIRLTTSCSGSKVTVEVADTGVGIPQELINRVMEPFFTTKPSGSGTGLGLSVSQSIVERFGGAIHISSAIGRGTVVKIVLNASAKPRATSDVLGVPPPVVQASPPVPAPRRARVLIIDDELPVAKALARLVGTAAHDISMVSSGTEALTVLAKDQTFDVIFCDLMLPDVTGMDIFARVKEHSSALTERMIFISGGVFTAAGREFVDALGDRFLEKPFEASRVRQVFARVIEISRSVIRA